MTAQGKMQDQIAYECGIKIKSVENTIAKAKERLGAKTVSQAVIIAISREELGIDHDGHCFVALDNF